MGDCELKSYRKRTICCGQVLEYCAGFRIEAWQTLVVTRAAGNSAGERCSIPRYQELQL